MYNKEYMEHAGIKGMKWGQRNFQSKDGTWTPLGLARRREREGFGEGGESSGGKKSLRSRIFSKKKSSSDTAEETEKKKTPEEERAERREKALKSTNAKEIYESRDLLTTSEIKERLDRIDTEARLGRIAESTKKTGMDRVDQAIKYFRKANEVYELTNTSLGKEIKKILGQKVEENLSPDLKKVWENRNKMTDEQMQKVLKRATTEKTIKKMMDELEAESKKAEAQKQVDDYNNNGYKDDKVTSSGEYSKKGSDIIDNKVGTGNTNPNIPRLPGPAEKVSGTVEGTGKSKGGFKDNSKVVDAKEGVDYTFVSGSSKVSDAKNTASYSTGKNETTRLLETIGNRPLLLEDKRGG